MKPYHLQGATWSSPLTSRLLAEAGWGTFEARLPQSLSAHRWDA